MLSYIFKKNNVLNLVRKPEVDKFLFKKRGDSILIISEREEKNQQSSIIEDAEKATKLLNL